MAEAKTVQLTIGERVKALGVLNSFKGNIDTHAYAFDDAKILSVTDEEWTKANLVKTPSQNDTEQWKWDDVETKEIAFHSEIAAYITKAIKEKSDSNQIELTDGALISLYKKLTE